MKIAKQQVTLIDHMGSDLSVVNAARVSFHKESKYEEFYPDDGLDFPDYRLPEKDVKLINYLAKHNHWSPFAHTSIQLRVSAPIFVARQLVKHQVGGVWNEVSRRYIDDEPEFYFPDVWRGKPENAKQGSSGEVDDSKMFRSIAVETSKECLAVYKNMIACGVAPEQARMILPQNTMTEWIWTGSLQFFARVCKLRLDPHAQQETQEVAAMIQDIVSQLFPVSWAALMQSE